MESLRKFFILCLLLVACGLPLECGEGGVPVPQKDVVEILPALPLKIEEIIPSKGPATGDSLIVIKGRGFDETLKAYFGAEEAKAVYFISDEEISVKTPQVEAGKYDVILKRGDGASARAENAFEFYSPESITTPLPIISSIIPQRGPPEGGTAVLINGKNFTEGSIAFFGGFPATKVNVPSPENITCLTPSHPEGVVDVSLTDPDGRTVYLLQSFTYSKLPQGYKIPFLNSIIPPQGSVLGGTQTKINGENLNDVILVLFGDKPALEFKVDSDETISAKTPEHKAGNVTIYVSTSKGATSFLEDAFTFYKDAPVINLVNPNKGSVLGGIEISIYGKNFKEGVAVLFGENPSGKIAFISDGEIKCELPQGNEGFVDIIVRNPDGLFDLLKNGFEYFDPLKLPAPEIYEVSPNKGSVDGGYYVLVSGKNFQEGVEVFFGDKKSEDVSLLTSEILSSKVPQNVEGKVDVKVVNPDGKEAILSGGFEYEKGAAIPLKPFISQILPAKGPDSGGTYFVLYGGGFEKDAKAYFGDKQAIIFWTSSNALVGKTPPSGKGSVDIKIVNPSGGEATLKDGFLFYSKELISTPPPEAQSLKPSQGPLSGGTISELKGLYFEKEILIFYGFIPAQIIEYIDATSVVVKSPPSDFAGSVDVIVTNPDGQSGILENGFNYFEPSPKDIPPAIDSIKPSTSSFEGGVDAVLTGNNFKNGAIVFFGGSKAKGVDVKNQNTLFLIVPPHKAGIVDVFLTNPDGFSAVLKNGFQYITPPPLISEISPKKGLLEGGEDVKIEGKNFSQGAKVYFGENELINIKVISPYEIRGKTPKKDKPGSVDVMVENPDGQKDIKKNAFTYYEAGALPPPTILSISPDNGDTSGNYLVVITGLDFAEGAKVFFGDSESMDVQFLSSQILIAKVPSAEAGSVDVRVLNPDGQEDILKDSFTYISKEVPLGFMINNITPNGGSIKGDYYVTIGGGGFETGMSAIFCENVSEDVIFLSTNALIAKVPSGKVGVCDVKVVSAKKGEAILKKSFFYFDPQSIAPFPDIYEIIPNIGPSDGGTYVAIKGKDFSVKSGVIIDEMSAIILSSSEKTIIIKTPPHKPQSVSLTVYNPDGKFSTIKNAFTYYEDISGIPGPLINLVEPSQGSILGGEDVLVGGKFFKKDLLLIFDGEIASINSVSDNEIKAKTPAAPKTGLVDVIVSNPDGKSTILPNGFKYTPPQLKIETLIPNSGPKEGGTFVVISGNGFVEGTKIYIGGKSVKELTYLGPTSMRMIVPPGSAGSVDITAINPDGQKWTLKNGYTYTEEKYEFPPPLIKKIVPDRGPTTGGTISILYGDFFQESAKVIFGGKDAVKIEFIDKERIVAITPPNEIGKYDVVVINPDGQGATLTAGFTYIIPSDPPPKIFGITPTEGPEVGGTKVIISGANFKGGGNAYFNLIPVNNFALLNEAIITATTPPNKPGSSDVYVVNGDGQTTKLSGGFIYIASPHLQGINPDRGPVAGGTLVTIAGKGFQKGAIVKFGDKDGVDILVVSENAIKCKTPPNTEGVKDVVVINPDGQKAILENGFTYLLPPQLVSIFPEKGSPKGGFPFILRGENFVEGISVKFGEKIALGVSVVDKKTLTAIVPEGKDGEVVDVKALDPYQQAAVLYDAFTYSEPITPKPQIKLINPKQGPVKGGTLAVMSGENFIEGAQVLVAMRPSDLTFVESSVSATFLTPEGKEGIAEVSIINPDGGYATLPDAFTYVTDELLDEPPEISTLDPSEGPTKGGTQVKVSGKYFKSEAIVFFGYRVGVGTILNEDGSVSTITPKGEPGIFDLYLTNPDGQSAFYPQGFRFVPPPVIIAVSPDTGPSIGGVKVLILGENFVAGKTSEKSSKVLFCTDYEKNKDCVVVPSMETDVMNANKIEVITPKHTPGLAQVVIVNPDGQIDILEGGFYFSPPPEIIDIKPSSGSTNGGEDVTITGGGFTAGTIVKFGEKMASDIKVWDSTKITCKTPPHEAGKVSVCVINPDGMNFCVSGGFEFIPPPIIKNIYPTTGPETGGTKVTIEGKYFVMGEKHSIVYFGKSAVSEKDTQILSPMVIIVISPPGKGLVSISVLNPDGQEGVVPGAFTYIPPQPPPKISYISPNYAMTSGGTQVKVVGENFLDGAKVFFGKEPKWVEGFNPVVKNNGTLIITTIPSYNEGVVDVKVINTDNQEDVLENSFTYIGMGELPPLAFIDIAPERGPSEGGVEVTILGRGFKQGINVFFGNELKGWAEAEKVIRLGPTALWAKTPPAPSYLPDGMGAVDLKLLNPDGESVVATGVFKYGFKGVFVLKQGHRLPVEGSDDDMQVLIFDANGDKLNDILVMHNYVKYSRMLINTKTPTGEKGWFIEQKGSIPDVNAGWRFPVIFDFDKDGDKDIVAIVNNVIHIFYNAGDGVFTVKSTGISIDYVSDMKEGDLNCDGNIDIVVVRNTTSKDRPNGVLVGDGKGGFVWKTPFPAHYEPSMGVDVGDVDNDGDLDVLVANDSAYQNRLYYNNCNNINVPPSCAFKMCNNVSYAGHNYAICQFSVNWYQARAQCAVNGYYLLTINDANEQNFINGKINQWHWIGYNDIAEEGKWVWDGEDSTYTFWQSGQPDDSGKNEDCAAIKGWGDGKWNDINCDTGGYYICESNKPLCEKDWKFVEATPGVNFPISGGKSKDCIFVDIDKDNFLDAIIINAGVDQQNSVYMNKGASQPGKFLNDDGIRYPQNEENKESYKVYVTDVELDGDNDLLILKKIAGNPDRFWPFLYLNDKNNGGIGEFKDVTKVNIPQYNGEYSVSFGIGDMDDDFLSDIFIVCKDHQDWMFMNNGYLEDKPKIESNKVGEGVFVNNTIWDIPQDNDDSTSIAAGDIDNDGDIDVVVTNWLRPLKIYINDGKASFFNETSKRMPEPNKALSATGVILIDIDKDEDLDIFVSCYYEDSLKDGQVKQYINNGAGYFSDVTVVNMPDTKGLRHYNIDAADIDNDKDTDLVFAGYYCYWGCSSYLKILINGGDPWGIGGAFFFDKTSQWIQGPTARSRIAKFVDFNNDKYIDLYIGDTGEQNQLYFNDEGKNFVNVTQAKLPAVNDNTYDVEIADYDGDKDLDIISVNNNQFIRLFMQEKDNKFSDLTMSNMPLINFNAQASSAGDVDGDSFVDIIIANWRQKNALFMNFGAGKFENYSDNLPWEVDYSKNMVLADFDNDGDLDLFVTNLHQNRLYINTSK